MNSPYARELAGETNEPNRWERERLESIQRRNSVELPPVDQRPTCRHCRRRLRPYSMRGQPGFEGRLFGDYGDNVFCGLRCGYAYGVRALAARGQG